MLDNDLQQQLKTYLEKIIYPIELIAYTAEDQASQDLRALLTQIASLSSLVSLKDGDASSEKAVRTPSFTILRTGSEEAVSFAAIPLGHEFTSLVLALLQVGGHPGKISEELAQAVRNLEGDFRFETFMSLQCQSCPDTVQALNLMSVLNPNIKHIAIDGALFQDEVKAREVMAVPTVFLNGAFFDTGRLSIEQIMAKLDTGAEARTASVITAKEPFEVLVLGGGPAGAASAIYTARKGLRTGLVTERFGGQVLDTMSIENFVSVEHTEGPQLASAMENHVRQYDVDIMNGQKVAKVIPSSLEGGLHTVVLESGATLKSRTLILSTGASWRTMNVPGENAFRNKGVTFCPHCDGPLFKGKKVAVIGGGNSGIEAAIDLAGIVEHVTVIEFSDNLRADEVLQQKLKSMPNTKIIMQAATSEIFGDQKVRGLRYTDRRTNATHDIDIEGVFVQIGLVPNTSFLKDIIALNPLGEVVVDAHGRTNILGILAAGDCTTVPYKQIITAMGAGSTAALSAFDYLIRNDAPNEVLGEEKEAKAA